MELMQRVPSERRAPNTAGARGKNAIFSIVVAMKVDVLVLDGVFNLGFSAVLDVFRDSERTDRAWPGSIYLALT